MFFKHFYFASFYIDRDAMEVEHIEKQQFSSFLYEGSFLRGTKCAILLNLSTMVRITEFPAEGGRQVMKSSEM